MEGGRIKTCLDELKLLSHSQVIRERLAPIGCGAGELAV